MGNGPGELLRKRNPNQGVGKFVPALKSAQQCWRQHRAVCPITGNSPLHFCGDANFLTRVMGGQITAWLLWNSISSRLANCVAIQ